MAVGGGLRRALVPRRLQTTKVVPILTCSRSSRIFLVSSRDTNFNFVYRPLYNTSRGIRRQVGNFLGRRFPSGAALRFILFHSPSVGRRVCQVVNLHSNFHRRLLASIVGRQVGFLRRRAASHVFTGAGGNVCSGNLVRSLGLFIAYGIPVGGGGPARDRLRRLTRLHAGIRSSLRAINLHPHAVATIGCVQVVDAVLG